MNGAEQTWLSVHEDDSVLFLTVPFALLFNFKDSSHSFSLFIENRMPDRFMQ